MTRVMLNVRIRARHQPTDAEARAAASTLFLTGLVPDGWEVAFIDWLDPDCASPGWSRGPLPEAVRLALVDSPIRLALVRVDP